MSGPHSAKKFDQPGNEEKGSQSGASHLYFRGTLYFSIGSLILCLMLSYILSLGKVSLYPASKCLAQLGHNFYKIVSHHHHTLSDLT